MSEIFVQFKELWMVALPIFFAYLGSRIKTWHQEWKTRKFQLKDHRLFSDLVVSVNDINSWYPAENRTVFVDALRIKLEAWRDEGIKLAEILQKKSYSNLQLDNVVTNWVTKVVKNYTNEWQRQDIPRKIIIRITKIHQIKVKEFITEVRAISYNDDMYPFKMQKCIAIFDILRLLLSDTKNDFNTLVYREKYNGEFIGIKYKNIPINDEDYKKYKQQKLK